MPIVGSCQQRQQSGNRVPNFLLNSPGGEQLWWLYDGGLPACRSLAAAAVEVEHADPGYLLDVHHLVRFSMRAAPAVLPAWVGGRCQFGEVVALNQSLSAAVAAQQRMPNVQFLLLLFTENLDCACWVLESMACSTGQRLAILV
jgi:hypothetical protein